MPGANLISTDEFNTRQSAINSHCNAILRVDDKSDRLTTPGEQTDSSNSNVVVDEESNSNKRHTYIHSTSNVFHCSYGSSGSGVRGGSDQVIANTRFLDESDLEELILVKRNHLDKCCVDYSHDFDQKQWNQFYSFPRLILSDSSNENCLDPFVLQPSLFHNNRVPPVIYFTTKLSDDSKPPIGLPKSLQCYFKWKISSITPNSIRNCISFMKFETIRSPNSNDAMYLGSWCKHMLTNEFLQLEDWRKVNHFPGSFHLGRKDKLWIRLKQANNIYGREKFGNFHPITFVLPRDYKELCDYWKKSPSKLFIIKPPASARGNGIKVINDISQIPASALQNSTQLDGLPSKKSTMIVQQYISNPCLLENGQKFDLRIYVLLTSIDPLRIYIYNEGLVRFASTKYTKEEDDIIDQFMHLTNYFINKNNQEYQINNDCDSLNGCKWTLKRFWRYLREHYTHIDVQQLWEDIKDIIIKTIICCEGPMTRLSHQNCKNDYTAYELFGFDIILDENFKPWILEVNITPSLKSESNLDMMVKYGVIKDMFNLVGYNLPPPIIDDVLYCTHYQDCPLFFDDRLYTEILTKRDKMKHIKYQKMFKNDLEQGQKQQRDLISSSILNDLSQNDVRVLMLAEDELSRCGQFQRVFPSPTSSKYLIYFDRPRYYNLLLDSWERTYQDNRLDGIKRLSNLAKFLSSYKETEKPYYYQADQQQLDLKTQGLFDSYASQSSTDESKLRLALLVEDKIDVNKDGTVQLDELVKWLHKCQDKYADEDVKRHWYTFSKTIAKKDDTLNWDVYAKHEYEHMDSLAKQSGSAEQAKQIKQSKDNLMRKDFRRWKAADLNHDGRLSKDEYKLFLYPEHSHLMHDLLVEEKMESIDRNKDGRVSMNEYLSDSTVEGGQLDSRKRDEWLNNERTKFINQLDLNHDNYLDKQELATWISKSELDDHSVAEAQQLMNRADANKDYRLTKEEILSAYADFVNSHATDFGEALRGHKESSHDEL